jgi:hypothetical protein
VTFTVDNTAPTVTITGGPAGQALPPDSTQTWTFTASDGAGSGIQSVQCKLDGAPATCTTPTSHTVSHLPAGTHTFSVTATDKLGHVSAPESRTFSIAAPAPTPVPTAEPTPLPTVAPTPVPTPPPPPPPPPRLIRSTVVFAYASFTRLTRLTVKHLPAGATVRLTCSGSCPKALKRPWTKQVSHSELALARLVRGQLRPGMKVVIAVSKPGWIGTKKTLRIRRGKAPTVD